MISNLLTIAFLVRDALMYKHVLTLLCLVCAMALYAMGWNGGATSLILLGGAFELAFWIRLARIGGPPSVRSPKQ